MKHLTLIIHTDAQQDMADQLRSLEQVSGFTFSHAEGHGVEAESDPFLSARDKVVGYTPRIRVDILLEDGDVDLVLESLRKTTRGIEGQGIYWVTAVEQNGHL
jgi:nitrogen regulatory protein P-II 1